MNHFLLFCSSHFQLSVLNGARMRSLVSEYSDCFVNPADGRLGLTDLMECKIETLPGTTPVCKYPYCLTPAMREEVDKILKDQVKKGLI